MASASSDSAHPRKVPGRARGLGIRPALFFSIAMLIAIAAASTVSLGRPGSARAQELEFPALDVFMTPDATIPLGWATVICAEARWGLQDSADTGTISLTFSSAPDIVNLRASAHDAADAERAAPTVEDEGRTIRMTMDTWDRLQWYGVCTHFRPHLAGVFTVSVAAVLWDEEVHCDLEPRVLTVLVGDPAALVPHSATTSSAFAAKAREHCS